MQPRIALPVAIIGAAFLTEAAAAVVPARATPVRVFMQVDGAAVERENIFRRARMRIVHDGGNDDLLFPVTGIGRARGQDPDLDVSETGARQFRRRCIRVVIVAEGCNDVALIHGFLRMAGLWPLTALRSG